MQSINQTERHSITYGSVEISYSITFRNRKTLSISVQPTGAIFVVAPMMTPLTQIAERVRRKAAWIIRQRERFRQLGQHESPTRQFISGETYYYLGRQYRLKIAQGDTDQVCLRSGRLWVTARSGATPESIEKLLTYWYRQRAEFVIYPLFKQCLGKIAD